MILLCSIFDDHDADNFDGCKIFFFASSRCIVNRTCPVGKFCIDGGSCQDSGQNLHGFIGIKVKSIPFPNP